MRTVKVAIIGNLGVGKTISQVRTVICLSKARYESSLHKVCLWPILDSLTFNYWHRFHHQDSPITPNQMNP